MRLALLSDIHANLQALQACVAHAQAQQPDRLAFLGDLVGYGANPGQVVQCIQDLQAQGAVVLQGNHDAMAVTPPQKITTYGDSTAGWTHSQLSDSQRHWLAGLPLLHHADTVLLVHASANEPARWRYVTNGRTATDSMDAAQAFAGVRYVLGGHVHTQTVYYQGAGSELLPFTPLPGLPIPVPPHRLWLATIGSVGQPRDGKPLAMYALLDTERAQLTFHRVAYDHMAAADAIRAAGLPGFFAERLEMGR